MSKRILIVDDAPVMRELIKDVAVEQGWLVVGEAGCGQEAVAQWEALRPDLTTLDLMMPATDGMYALERIKKLAGHAKVIVVSALDQRPVLKKAFQAGAADFVVKPFDRQKLAATLAALATE